jgi:hypothetical protein
MKYKKGESGNPAGKPKGAINEKTKAWEQLGDFITETGADRVKDILTTCTNDQFMFYYPMLLEYFKPKRARVDKEGETANTVIIIDSE